jgi:hypothetical protein
MPACAAIIAVDAQALQKRTRVYDAVGAALLFCAVTVTVLCCFGERAALQCRP